MQAGNRSETGFTLVELACCVAIVACLIALAMPSLQQVLQDSRRSRSFSNMRQIHLALLNYCERESGDVFSLPASFAATRKLMGIPDEVLHTGGIAIIPGQPGSDVYSYVWPNQRSNERYRAQWAQYVAATSGNPVIIIDDTYPRTQTNGPFVLKSHFGIFWEGAIRHRRYAGIGQNLRENWRP